MFRMQHRRHREPDDTSDSCRHICPNPSPVENTRRSLISVRTAVVVLCAVLAGIGTAVLTVLAGHTGFEGGLLGAGTTAAATRFFDWLINRDDSRR